MSSTVLRTYYHIRIFIVQLTRAAFDQWSWLTINGTKMLSTSFIYFSNHDTSNIPNFSNPTVNSSLASQTKCHKMFLDSESDHMFLLVCGNYPPTPKWGRCRNLLFIDSWLNWIDASTNNIFLKNTERGYITKSEIILVGVFQYRIE